MNIMGSEGGIKMAKFMKTVIMTATVWLVLVLIIYPKNCIEAGLGGVFLCLNTVIPSLFPFFVCSGIIIGFGMTKPLEKIFAPFMRPVFGVSGVGALPFVLGILSGYPVGAKCVADLYKKGCCSKAEAEKLLVFCNNSGPLFILGAVGAGMANSPALGRYLYIIHILSAFVTGMIFRFRKIDEKNLVKILPLKEEHWSKVVTESVLSATESMITVCGFVILFSVVGAALPKIGVSPIIHGLLEITGGTEKILKMNGEFGGKLLVISGIIAFSGFSVMLQVFGIIGKTDLSTKPYIAGKAVQGVAAIILTAVFLKIFPISEQTGSFSQISTINIWKISVLMSCLILFVLLAVKKKAVDN